MVIGNRNFGEAIGLLDKRWLQLTHNLLFLLKEMPGFLSLGE